MFNKTDNSESHRNKAMNLEKLNFYRGKIKWCFCVFILAMTISYATELNVKAKLSPYEHSSLEIDPDRAPLIWPGKRPIVYPYYWGNEREIYAYNPRFMPNRVSFGPDNRPFIVAGVHNKPGSRGVLSATIWPTASWVDEAYLQTLNDQGKWVVYSLSTIIKSKYPDWDGKILAGVVACQNVYVDNNGEVYLLVHTDNKGTLLLHGRKHLSFWNVYNWPWDVKVWRTGSMEMPTTHTFKNWKPIAGNVIKENGKSLLRLLKLDKKPDGSLKIPDFLPATKMDIKKQGNIWLGGPQIHSGASNAMVTIGDKTHIVFASSKQDPRIKSKHATPHYAITYNHRTAKYTKPVLLGGTDSVHYSSDFHNLPTMVADSKGFLHVVLGSHQNPLVYLKSTKANSTARWTKPMLFSSPDPRGYETYPALVIDQNDILYCVSRRAAGSSKKPRYYMKDRPGHSRMVLHLMRKRPKDKKWQEMGDLVIPYSTGYCGYYHRMSVDRLGRLFLAYQCFPHSKKKATRAKEIYAKKWPDDPWGPRDPALLMSDDQGQTWRLATTKDFLLKK